MEGGVQAGNFRSLFLGAVRMTVGTGIIDLIIGVVMTGAAAGAGFQHMGVIAMGKVHRVEDIGQLPQ